MLAINTIQTVMKDARMREQADLIRKEVGALLNDVRLLSDRVAEAAKPFQPGRCRHQEHPDLDGQDHRPGREDRKGRTGAAGRRQKPKRALAGDPASKVPAAANRGQRKGFAMDHDFYWLFLPLLVADFPPVLDDRRHGQGLVAPCPRQPRPGHHQKLCRPGQGPAAELLKSLQGGGYGGWCGRRHGGRYSLERRLHRAFLFAALAIAFAVLTFWHALMTASDHHHDLRLV